MKKIKVIRNKVFGYLENNGWLKHVIILNLDLGKYWNFFNDIYDHSSKSEKMFTKNEKGYFHVAKKKQRFNFFKK